MTVTAVDTVSAAAAVAAAAAADDDELAVAVMFKSTSF